MDKFKSWLPIIVFLFPLAGTFFTLQADAKHLKEKVIKTEEKIEELTKEEKEARLTQIEIDTRQTVLLESMYKLQEKIEAELKEKERRPR